MKTYILVNHATSKEIEVKAEVLTAYPDVYHFKIGELVVGMFDASNFSFYIKTDQAPTQEKAAV